MQRRNELLMCPFKFKCVIHPLVVSQLGNSTRNEHHYNTRERINSSPLWVKHEKKNNKNCCYISFIYFEKTYDIY